MVAFSLFLKFAAHRYHEVYCWAHHPDHNISPEQFYRRAGNASFGILLVVAAAVFFHLAQ